MRDRPREGLCRHMPLPGSGACRQSCHRCAGINCAAVNLGLHCGSGGGYGAACVECHGASRGHLRRWW
uniref:Uncharacterized protein n=1 Tax=uncultured alpha proteobacterium HF0010_13E22 TaxID=710801 RepID=E0XR13_9PROT|nr:hypothetical protein [uncultured alpha proteobacterium HF0010_13E22]